MEYVTGINLGSVCEPCPTEHFTEKVFREFQYLLVLWFRANLQEMRLQFSPQ